MDELLKKLKKSGSTTVLEADKSVANGCQSQQSCQRCS